MALTDDLNPVIPPPFMKLKDDATDVNLAESWDAWAVEPTGNEKADYLKGVEYADIALRKVAVTDNPAAMTMPLFAMVGKLLSGESKGSAIEKGFVDRLASLACDRRQQLDAN